MRSGALVQEPNRRGQTAVAAKYGPHGLTAETVVVALEDIEDYHAFEAAVIADCMPGGWPSPQPSSGR
jgi:hypothetical protein